MFIDIEQVDGICILHCKGRLIAGTEMEYMQIKMDEIKRLACTSLLADFENVTSIGSMGVAFVVGAYTSVMRKPGGRFVLVGVNPLVKHVLHLTRLSTVLPMAPDLASGIALLKSEAPPEPMAFNTAP